jgi:hypothetical protein
MRKALVLFLLFCFLTPFAFAQNKEEVKEEVKIEMEQLKKDMEQLRQDLKANFEDLKIDLSNMEIDLSGLEELKDMDWQNHPGFQEGMDYLNSEEFKREMARVNEEVKRAMDDVRLEMKELDNIDWGQINRAIEEAMKEVRRELPRTRREE